MLRPFGKRFVYFLIAVLLLAQQGFALHALSHGVDAVKAASTQESDQRAPLGDRHCDLCLTYAQVAAGATPALPTVVVAVFSPAVASPTHIPRAADVAAAYRSRAPPRAV